MASLEPVPGRGMIRPDVFRKLAHVHASEESKLTARMIERGHRLRSEDDLWPVDEAYDALLEVRDEMGLKYPQREQSWLNL